MKWNDLCPSIVSQKSMGCRLRGRCSVRSTSRSRWSSSVRPATCWPVVTASWSSTRTTSIVTIYNITQYILYLVLTFQFFTLQPYLINHYHLSTLKDCQCVSYYHSLRMITIYMIESTDLMFVFWSSYQFLEDAYKNHKQHMESMTHRLQEKQKMIEEVSNSINIGYVFPHTTRYVKCAKCIQRGTLL